MTLHGRMSAIDLQHLRYAVAARDQGSLRRAAESLLVQQSTLSRCIRQLEHSIGMTIFERSSGGVRATDAGRDFLHLARSILEQVDSLVTTAHRTGRGEAGRLTIGFYTSLAAGNLRATLVDYARRFPEIELGMIEGSRAPSWHRSARRRNRHRHRDRRNAASAYQVNVALERTPSGCTAGWPSAGRP